MKLIIPEKLFRSRDAAERVLLAYQLALHQLTNQERGISDQHDACQQLDVHLPSPRDFR